MPRLEPESFSPVDVTLETATGQLAGTLLAAPEPTPLVVLIAGSGPTDRDGNQPRMQNDCLKQVAEAFARAGIASLRYDKRGIAQSAQAGRAEAELRFEHYVEDAEAWIRHCRQDPRFERMWVIGHSEGSLIGMLAARHCQTAGFISLAGAGLPADQILLRQLSGPSPERGEQVGPLLARLKNKQLLSTYPQDLEALFRPSVQPYLVSWFQYDPRAELARLTQPVLIVQGRHDLQVLAEDALALAAARPGARLSWIEDMNHILKAAPVDPAANLQTYGDPARPLHPELMPLLIDFVRAYEPA